MIRFVRLLAALAAALMLGAVTMQPALAATKASGPTPGQDLSGQLSTLLQQLKDQQATVNTLANQVESEQATVNTLNSKVSTDKQQEALLNHQMDQVARIEYERPALTLTTILDAQNLGELLSGVAQSRLIAKQQQQLFTASAALKAKDQQDQQAAQLQLDKISQQKNEATAIAANTQSEIADLQQQQASAQAASSSSTSSSPAPLASASAAPAVAAGATITLQPGPSNPNRFDPGQCVWYVAQIYSIPWMGNANQWPAAAAADGQAEGMTPVVGAIMESADSSFGHVSVVTAVTDYNDWTVTEMNYMGPFVTDTRQVSRGSSNLVTFIY
jgi:peptidoglycan DL-endopeptidase CwlO